MGGGKNKSRETGDDDGEVRQSRAPNQWLVAVGGSSSGNGSAAVVRYLTLS